MPSAAARREARSAVGEGGGAWTYSRGLRPRRPGLVVGLVVVVVHAVVRSQRGLGGPRPPPWRGRRNAGSCRARRLALLARVRSAGEPRGPRAASRCRKRWRRCAGASGAAAARARGARRGRAGAGDDLRASSMTVWMRSTDGGEHLQRLALRHHQRAAVEELRRGWRTVCAGTTGTRISVAGNACPGRRGEPAASTQRWARSEASGAGPSTSQKCPCRCPVEGLGGTARSSAGGCGAPPPPPPPPSARDGRCELGGPPLDLHRTGLCGGGQPSLHPGRGPHTPRPQEFQPSPVPLAPPTPGSRPSRTPAPPTPASSAPLGEGWGHQKHRSSGRAYCQSGEDPGPTNCPILPFLTPTNSHPPLPTFSSNRVEKRAGDPYIEHPSPPCQLGAPTTRDFFSISSWRALNLGASETLAGCLHPEVCCLRTWLYRGVCAGLRWGGAGMNDCTLGLSAHSHKELRGGWALAWVS